MQISSKGIINSKAILFSFDGQVIINLTFVHIVEVHDSIICGAKVEITWHDHIINCMCHNWLSHKLQNVSKRRGFSLINYLCSFKYNSQLNNLFVLSYIAS